MVKTTNITEEENIRTLLGNVMDPEIPVLSVNDLGIVRRIKVMVPLQQVEIVITPTYSGCPAMDVIAINIRMELLANGYQKITVTTELSPAWTTDWMSDQGKQKLKEYGIVPPAEREAHQELFAEAPPAECPQCHSSNTFRISEFGSTACKALYQCRDCGEPFDVFKCH